ncbi:MAG: SufS family cysteine desulfurase [Verrucomicrobia bacterium]|nr:SufS family cysteine desulfurase [Verrucomicrobiota bacterium]
MNPETRALFPIFAAEPDLVYLDSAATAHKPQAVIDELTRFYSAEYATVHRSIYRSSMAATEKYNETRLTAQRFLNAPHLEEIVFTRGTTEALNLVAFSQTLRPGDEILLSETEHHSNIVPWQMAAERTGAQIRWIPVLDDGSLDLAAYKKLLNNKTRIVGIAHISNVTGAIHPIREMAALAHVYGAKIVVDGAQAAPHTPIDVQELDVDFYAFSGHKCYGPTGVGILYGKLKHLEEMPPMQGGGDMVETVGLHHSTFRAPPLKFEAGTPLIGPVIALKPALDLLLKLDRKKISNWEHQLYDRAAAALSEIPGLKILGTTPNKGALLTFTIDGIHPLDLATMLDLKQIAIRTGHLCAQTALRRFGVETAARASFGVYNTMEDVDLFVAALQSVVYSLLPR